MTEIVGRDFGGDLFDEDAYFSTFDSADPEEPDPCIVNGCFTVEPEQKELAERIERSIARLIQQSSATMTFTFALNGSPLKIGQGFHHCILGTPDSPLGYARYRLYPGKQGHRAAEIVSLETFRHGEGLGTQLLQVMKSNFCEIRLTECQPDVIDFYRRRGFRQLGRRNTENGTCNMLWRA